METLDWRHQAMDWNIRRRVCSARKGQKRVESLGVRVSDIRPSVMRMDLGKARQGCWNRRCCPTSIQFLAISFFNRTVHRSIVPVWQLLYCSERFWLSLLPIRGLPTAPTSTLLTTRCAVRYRTTFVRRKCQTLTIWSSIWLRCGTVWSKASSMMWSTSGFQDFIPVSVWKATFWTVFVTCTWTLS